MALELKDKGNDAYRAKEYAKAIILYSEALAAVERKDVELLTTLYSNRAACTLQLKPLNLKSVLNDCNNALKLDERHVKSMYRKASALKKQILKIQVSDSNKAYEWVLEALKLLNDALKVAPKKMQTPLRRDATQLKQIEKELVEKLNSLKYKLSMTVRKFASVPVDARSSLLIQL